jgi:hypothetical protein
MSGYTNCACRDCFETAISDDDSPALCWECEEAGCDADGGSECCCAPDWEDEGDNDCHAEHHRALSESIGGPK